MRNTLIASSAMLICGFYQPDVIQPDYSASELTETNYVFHCEGNLAELKLVEEFRPRDQVSRLADRWRIRLVELSVAGRSIFSVETGEAARALGRYSWLTRVQGRCAGANVYIRIEGMPAEEWADYAEGRIASRPPISGNEIDIDRTGQVTIR